jgi:predicted HAD superfamily Cof-like phosphohydrolase
MFIEWYEKVKEFHKEFGIPYSDSFVKPDPKIILEKIRLIEEEIMEYSVAVTTDDLIEQADALADLIYVILNYNVVFGFKPNRGNVPMTNNPTPMSYGAGAIYIETFHRHVGALIQFAVEGDERGLVYQTTSFIVSVCNAAYSTGLDLVPIFNEVHRSNMTKIGGTFVDGKYIKPPTFEPPDLKRVIYDKV